MKNLMRITLVAALLLSAAVPHARTAADAPAEFVRRAATAAAGDQFTLASSSYSSASWRKLLHPQTTEQDGSASMRWYRPAWGFDELRIGMRGLTMDLQQRRNSALRCLAYLQ